MDLEENVMILCISSMQNLIKEDIHHEVAVI